MSWDIFSKSKIQYFLEKLKGKFVQKETGKGLSTNDFDNTYKSKVDKIDVSLSSISGNPISISGLKANQLAKNPIITFEPIQDLHGQSKPYPAGGGKNLLPLVLSDIKSANTAGTWSGNTYTIYGIAWTVLLDNANNIVGIRANGTADATNMSEFVIKVNFTTLSDSMSLLTGCPSGGSEATYSLRASSLGGDLGNGLALLSNRITSIYARVVNGVTVNNILYLPMVEKGTTKTAFAPYSNISPISGYDKVEALSCGVNVWDEEWELGAYSATNGSATTSTNSIRSKSTNYILIAPNKSYYMKYPGGYNLNICFYDVSRTFISNQVITASGIITTPTTAKYIRFNLSATYGTTYNNNISINYPSTDTDYHTYNKATSISESLGQIANAGKWYIRDGKFIITHGKKRMEGNDTFYGSNPGTNAQLPIVDMKPADTTNDPCTVCDTLEKSQGLVTGKTTIFIAGGVSNTTYIYNMSLLDPSINSSATLNAYLANHPIEFTYPLLNPIEIQLTPHEISLLKDYAYVSTNGTNIALDYHNGELASLGDVSQLGETVNELGKMAIRHKQVKLSSSVIGTSFSPTSRRIDKLGNLFGADCANQNNILSISVMQINVTPASMFICGYYNDYLWIASNQSCTLTGDAVFNITYIAN